MKKTLLTALILILTTVPAMADELVSDDTPFVSQISEQIAKDETAQAEAKVQEGITTSKNIQVVIADDQEKKLLNIHRFTDPDTGNTCYVLGEHISCAR